MNQALILGCSHAAGSELGLNLNLDHKSLATYQRTNSYPALVADYLGYIINNQAIPGGSNDAMFRLFESQVEHLSADSIVIACWSGFERTEVYDTSTEHWLPIAPNLPIQDHTNDVDIIEYFKYWILCHSDQQMRSGRLNKIKNILALNTLAQAHNIQVINVDSFWPVVDFRWPSSIHWASDQPFYDWACKNNFPRTAWGHFYEPAHKEFARLLADS
jgi:hypothetical protein